MEKPTDLFNQLLTCGFDGRRAAKFVATVVECSVLSGASSDEMLDTLRDVTRIGTLRGDNMRYVMECAPLLATRIATAYGAKNVGELRGRSFSISQVMDMVLKEDKS